MNGEVRSPAEFGNYIAGYTGQYKWGERGYWGVRAVGVIFDAFDRTADGKVVFDWDSDSVPDIDAGRADAILDLEAEDIANEQDPGGECSNQRCEEQSSSSCC